VEAQQLANDRRESEREQYKMTVEEIFEMVYREMEMNKNHFIIITPPNYLVKNRFYFNEKIIAALKLD